MKLLPLSLLLSCSISLYAAAEVVKVDTKFQDSKSCRVCHYRIVKEWEESWHAKSHYKNDEYFRKSLDYYARKTRKNPNAVKVECATCHNPRISVTSTSDDYEIAAVMGLTKGDSVDKAVNDHAISEGINCVVCHNVAKIHDEYDATKRGINRVEWTPSGTMTGPFKDAKSPYHKVIHHDFMDKTPDRLCFVCHANDRSAKGVVFTDMQHEYKKDTKSCVDCHMGAKRKDVAATFKMYGDKAKIRDVRHHGFIGAHTSTMWKDALKLSLEDQEESIAIKITNPQPHNIPSGFGSRELVLDVVYKSGSIVIEQKSISLTTHYTRKRKKVTTAHLAKKMSTDMSIPAKGERSVTIEKVAGTTSVNVKLSYVLVNDEVRKLLKLKEKKWSKKSLITSKKLELK